MKFNKPILFALAAVVLATSTSLIIAVDDFGPHTPAEFLEQAIEDNDINEVQRILNDLGPNLNEAVDPYEGNGRKPIHLAALRGYLDILKLLVQAGGPVGDINARDHKGQTALDLAIARGNTSVANYLRDLKGLGASTKTRMKDQRREAFTNVDVFFNK